MYELILFVLVITVVYGVLSYMEVITDIKKWNFGECPNCGNKLSFINFIEDNRNYHCDNCDYDCWIHYEVDMVEKEKYCKGDNQC